MHIARTFRTKTIAAGKRKKNFFCPSQIAVSQRHQNKSKNISKITTKRTTRRKSILSGGEFCFCFHPSSFLLFFVCVKRFCFGSVWHSVFYADWCWKQSILQTIYNLILLLSSGMWCFALSLFPSLSLSFVQFPMQEHQFFHSIELAAATAVAKLYQFKYVMMMTTIQQYTDRWCVVFVEIAFSCTKYVYILYWRLNKWCWVFFFSKETKNT